MNFIRNRNFRAGPQTSLEGFICPQNSDKQQKIKVFGRSGGAWAQTRPSKGDGKVGNPYIITKAEELKWFRDVVNRGRKNICAKIADNVLKFRK